MPKVYLVKWPDEQVSIVTAEDEKDLLRTVAANMGENIQCTFEPYMGENLFLTFKPRPSPVVKSSPLATCEPPDTQEEALKDFRALYNSRLFSDVDIEVGNQRIPCHRSVLSQRCSYFHAMFISNMQEASQKTVKLTGFSFAVIEAVIKFLYTGVLDIPQSKDADETRNNGRTSPEDIRVFNKDTKFPFLSEVLEAADFYGLSSLHKLCTSELVNIMNTDSGNMPLAEQVYLLGTKLEIPCLRDQACLVIGKELSQCMMCNLDMSQTIAGFSEDLRRHLRYVWEEKLQQHPLLFGKNRELIDSLTISPAAADEMVSHVKELITQGADAEQVEALHVLCQHSNMFSSNENYAELFRSLAEVFVAAGCNVNKLNYSDHSPLHIAAKQGGIEQVKTLLSMGADPMLKCRSHGYTPLEEVVYNFDEQAAIFAISSVHLLSPSRFLALRRSSFLACEQIVGILQEAMRTSQENNAANSSPGTSSSSTCSATPQQQNSDTTQEMEDIVINPYFIDRLFKYNELDALTRVEFNTENCGVSRKDLDDTLLEFMLPEFARELDTLQLKSDNSGAAVETAEAKKRLQSALTADLHNARSLQGSGEKLASLQRIKDSDNGEEGMFHNPPFLDQLDQAWLYRYDIHNLLDWERLREREEREEEAILSLLV